MFIEQFALWLFFNQCHFADVTTMDLQLRLKWILGPGPAVLLRFSKTPEPLRFFFDIRASMNQPVFSLCHRRVLPQL